MQSGDGLEKDIIQGTLPGKRREGRPTRLETGT